MSHKSHFRKLWVKIFSSANSSSVTQTASRMKLALAFLSFEIFSGKKSTKNDHFERWLHKMAHESHLWKLLVKIFYSAISTADRMGLTLAFLSFEN